MNDTSRSLRYELGTLCQRYNAVVADKDVLDVRLGKPEPYAESEETVNPERVYEEESFALSTDVRKLIVAMTDLGMRIREIEGF
jgi:hypothetical protein